MKNFQHYVLRRNRIRMIFVGLIILLLTGLSSATSIHNFYYDTYSEGGTSYTIEVSGVNQTDYYFAEMHSGIDGGNARIGHGYRLTHYGDYSSLLYEEHSLDAGDYLSYSGTADVSHSPSIFWCSVLAGDSLGTNGYVRIWYYVITSDESKYTISGTVCPITTNVKLYYYNISDYELINNETETNSYSYTIYNNSKYKLVFNNNHEYEFTCIGNMNYDYDGCEPCTINIYDECANLLHNQFTWIDDGGNIVYEGRDNPIIIPSSKVNINDKLTVMWTTWLGALQKTCYAQFDHPINLYDPFLYWDMEVYVYDNESNPIDHANIDFNQDCVINGYPTRNKYTDNSGMASFTQCENDNANLVVSKDGYKTLSTSVSGGWYDVYTPTYQVSIVLQSSDSDNSSTWDLINNSINDTNATEIPNDIPDANGTPNDIQLYFRNTEGYRITEVDDTDNYTRCYYSVNTPDDVDMTLVFQKSHSGYYFYDVYEYTSSIDNNSYGYFEIPNSYFNNSDYSYRAYIYDVSYPFDDRYAYLNVVNQTEPYYENLTGYCMFMHTNKNGSIDYREDITCYAMVISDNASLKTVSLELYDNSTLIDYTNLTYSDFLDDNIYGWYLGYNYTLGHNYSLVLRGYDDSILDCDNVIAKNIVGNKLTIKVTDSFNHPLNNVYVFCEHYGSINTGYLNYGTFEGLPNGETRYKASKSGYRSGLWSTVNLTSENKFVTYQLIQEIQEGSTAMVRLSDDDAKNLYYPLMYFLLILILLGALINVIK